VWSGDVAIPSPLADYRSWKALTSTPQPIPYHLAQLCAAMAPSLPTAPEHGPHANRWVMVYANPAADSALANASVVRFPVGAMIAKEKRIAADAAHPEGVAFMVKHRAGEFSGSGGWEFLYYSSAGASVDYEGCISCHRARGRKDYVFGSYAPPQGMH
jgi:hypothetical protein